jgi:O-antigen/teichoic acid export membrane protein
MIERIRKGIAPMIGESDFLKNTLRLVMGAGIAQAISIIASPVLTRFYSPDDFGQFTFFISIAGAFALIATLRYELAIVYARDGKESTNVVGLATAICMTIALILLVAVLIHHFFLSAVIPVSPMLGKWLFFLPLLVFMLGSGNILQNWFIRRKEYQLISADKIINSGVNNLLAILFGILQVGAWGLLIGSMTGTLVFVLFLLVVSLLKKQWIWSHFDRKTARMLAKKHSDLPTSNTLQAISEMMQNYGVIYLTRMFFTTSIVGLYALSMRILQAPLWLMGSSISQVYFKDASDQYNETGDIHGLLWKTIRIAALAAFPVMILLLIAGPWIFGTLFGQSWREAGVFSRILAPWMFFDFIRFTISQTPMLLGRARSMFLISLGGNLCMILSLTVGGLIFKDVRIGFYILSGLMSLYAVGVIFWIYRIAQKNGKPGKMTTVIHTMDERPL